MTIDGLNNEQIEMLNKMWTLDTEQELMEFRSTLPVFRQQQLDTLMEMVIQEARETDIERMDSYPDVEKMLKNILK